MRQTENLSIRFAEDADTPSVIDLWSLCFPGEQAFQAYFFEHLYQPQYNLLLLDGQMLCAMVQMLPYQLQNGSVSEPVTYIYGACTHPARRRRHYMDRLLHHSFALDRQAGRAASILIPQEEWLFGFYAQFGYQKAFSVTTTATEQFSSAKALCVRAVQVRDLGAMDGLYHRFLGSGPYLRRPAQEWDKQLALFLGTGGEVLCSETDGLLDGYAFVWPGEKEIWAQELVCRPDKLDGWIAALQQRYGKACCRLTGLQFAQQQTLGCMARYDHADPPAGYINLMLN